MTAGQAIQIASRNKKDWETPWWVVKGVEACFNVRFTLDAAGTEANKKAPRVITVEQDALSSRPWGKDETVWLNPPYGKEEVPAFIHRSLTALETGEATEIWMLIPNATDTAVWEHIWAYATEIHFVIGRIVFLGDNSVGNTRGSVLLRFKRNMTGEFGAKAFPCDRQWLFVEGNRQPRRNGTIRRARGTPE